MIDLKKAKSECLYLGYAGENNVTDIEFDYSGWQVTYGDGSLVLFMQRPGDTDPYPVPLEISDQQAIWHVTASDTARSGRGYAQLAYIVNDVIKKSIILETFINASLESQTVDPPEPIKRYVDLVVEKAIQAAASAETAEQFSQDAAESAEAAGASVSEAERIVQSIGVVDTGDGDIVITL